MISLLSVVLVGGILLQTGVLPPHEANADAGGGASGSPAPSGAPAPSGPAGSAPPASAAPPVAADVTITAQGIKFAETSFTAKAGAPFTIAFDNQDAGTPHNIEIKDQSGKAVFPGVKTMVYDVPALPAGTYPFLCSVHTDMTGTATIN
jgi:plastocyanin